MGAPVVRSNCVSRNASAYQDWASHTSAARVAPILERVIGSQLSGWPATTLAVSSISIARLNNGAAAA
ncbi:Uncharacterised protein [Mycobacterium tuberculosis]|nr:Uncharacterised protein [Mycobacterium tuberculosis]